MSFPGHLEQQQRLGTVSVEHEFWHNGKCSKGGLASTGNALSRC